MRAMGADFVAQLVTELGVTLNVARVLLCVPLCWPTEATKPRKWATHQPQTTFKVWHGSFAGDTHNTGWWFIPLKASRFAAAGSCQAGGLAQQALLSVSESFSEFGAWEI